MSLRDGGVLRVFKLGVSEKDYAIIEENDYCSYLKMFLKDHHSLLLHKLLQSVLPKCREVSITQQQMREMGVTESQQRQVRGVAGTGK